MIKNYILSLYRNIVRNKFYSALNIVGLSLGLAVAIFILLYVQDELSYDKYNVNHERIYRIESNFTLNNKNDLFAIVPIPMGPALKIEFPEIEEFVRFMEVGNTLFRHGEKEYYEENFYIADSSIFKIFTHKFLYGDPNSSLTEPKTIVITEKIAQKFFGNNNPLGEIITSGRGTNYKVTGVIKNLPGNSHLKFDALISTATMAEQSGAEDFNSLEPVRFWNIGVYTYLLLKENSSIKSIHEKFPAFYDKYMKSIGDEFNASYSLLSTPVIDTHFKKGLGAELPSGSKAYIIIFSAVAAFILLIAAINYMNMATARSANRAKEVGIRKVVGAYKNQLIRQFLSESVVLSLIAMLIAMFLVSLLLQDFNTMADKTLVFSLSNNSVIFAKILGITLIIGFISGSYPAFYLSSFLPVRVLKGTTNKSGKKGGMLRKILVVLQFFIAIFMIIGTIVIYGQLRFLKNKDLGFDKENLVVMEIQDSTFRSKIQTFKEELLLNPDIISATNSTGVPGRINWVQVVKIERESNMEDYSTILAQVDYDYIEAMKMEIVKGRNFDEKMGTDAMEAVIINESAVKEFGWYENPIGKKIIHNFNLDGTGGRVLKVIGVVKDFHFRSLHNKIEPLIIFISEIPRYLLSCRINSENKKETLEFIESKWNAFGAKRPFDFEYLNNSMDDMYKAEEKIGLIIGITTILTIFIALLGLLGLSSFVAEQKTKEIGIRKVVGASIGNILALLYKEFALLILIAFIISIPIAWWRLEIWLESSFIYHISIQWTSFILAGITAIVIGMLAISFFIIKAASGNPVDAIKFE